MTCVRERLFSLVPRLLYGLMLRPLREGFHAMLRGFIPRDIKFMALCSVPIVFLDPVLQCDFFIASGAYKIRSFFLTLQEFNIQVFVRKSVYVLAIA